MGFTSMWHNSVLHCFWYGFVHYCVIIYTKYHCKGRTSLTVTFHPTIDGPFGIVSQSQGRCSCLGPQADCTDYILL